MEKIPKLAFALLFLLVCGSASAFEKVLTFDPSDFEIKETDGLLHVRAIPMRYTYDFNSVGAPNLPFFQYVIQNETGCDISSIQSTVLKSELIASNVEIDRYHAYVPMGQYGHEIIQESQSDLCGIYPTHPLHIYNGPAYNDNRVILSISPFRYDSDEKKLYFVHQIAVSYLDDDLNSQERENICTRSSDSFDYLIITHDSLQSSFAKLEEWKTMKGVKTRIVTLDSIQTWYGGHSSRVCPLEIKSFINNCYLYHGLRAVLLGGSSDIVPSQICALEYAPSGYNPEYASAVSDYYYSCLNGSLDWDANHNGVIGEIEGDGVNLTPTVDVSRLPVDNNAQLTAYIDKLLQYEQCPVDKEYENRLFLSGSKAHWCRHGWSDAHVESEMLYEDIFQEQYPDIEEYAFYDTGNSLNRHGTDSIVNASNISAIINEERPHLMNMYSHGDDTYWQFDGTCFSTADASSLENAGSPMVITTIACHTANFASSDLCLAEAFIQHPDGGAVAYWGSSHYGWGNRDSTSYHFTPSMVMCSDFWTQVPNVHRYGQAVSEAKKSNLVTAYSRNLPYNWLLKTMNALGDCEMPIYTDRPQEFKNQKIRIASDAVFFEDYGELDSCTVAVTSRGDNGCTFFAVDNNMPSEILYDDGTSCNICMTGTNFVPFLIKTGRFVPDNQNFSLLLQDIAFKTCSVEYGSVRNMTIGGHVDSTEEAGDVVIEPGAEVTFFPDAVTTIQSGFRCEKGGQLNIGIIR